MANGSFSEREYRTLSGLLIEGEEAWAYAKQRKLSGALFYPTLAIATNKRLIIVNRWFMRLKSDITFIEYGNIASFRVVHGIMLSDIRIRLKGSSMSSGYIFDGGREEGDIKGLPREAADAMMKAINLAIHEGRALPQTIMREERAGSVNDGIYSNLSQVVRLEPKLAQGQSAAEGVTESFELPADYQVKPEELLIFKRRQSRLVSAMSNGNGTATQARLPERSPIEDQMQGRM